VQEENKEERKGEGEKEAINLRRKEKPRNGKNK
jgi:hypothetical protein